MDIKTILGLSPLNDVKSILCVQPHPDDNEVGAGGTLAYLAEKGCRIIFVTVTDGRYGTSNQMISPIELSIIRKKEKERAGNIIGVARHYDLGFEDSGHYPEHEVMEKLISIIRKEKPELVMTVDPWMPYEAHPDHYKVGRAVAAAVLASGNISYPSAGKPYAVPQMAFYATSYPNTFIDVTNYWHTKIKAILTHQSQFDNENWPILSQYFLYQAREWFQMLQLSNEDQMSNREGLAEAFKVLATRQLHFFPDAINS